MNDDSVVKIMQSLGLDYSPAITSIKEFSKHIDGLDRQLASMKANALNAAKDINNIFSSRLGRIAGEKTIVDQFGRPLKTIKVEAKETSAYVKNMAKAFKESHFEQLKAQAASIQQRVTTKGLTQEYAQQAATIREQLSLIQAKQRATGQLTAEEIKRTHELQEQLEILRHQTRTAIADDIREHPSTFSDEWQRRSSWFLTGTMFYGTINAAKEAIKTIKDVEMGMVELQRVMTDSSFSFKQYRDELFQLGVQYGQTFENVQQIALRWAQSGYNVADSLELTKTSLLALNTAELDAKQATEAMIGIMAQWELEAEEMALVMDKINITADRFTTTSQDLVDGLLRSSGAARIMNLSIDETIGLLTVMREASGRTGREVGNALNSILSYIQRPRSINLLEELGISVFADEAQTQFRNVLEIFQDIAARWNTLSTDIQDGFVQAADDAELFNEELATALGMQEEWTDLQQRDIAQASAGVYRRNYFIGMIERLANVQKVLNNLIDAEGYSMRENIETMEALEKKQESLKASMQALAVAAGDAGLGGTLKALADGGTAAFNALNNLDDGLKDFIMAMTSTFLAAKTLQLGMKTFGIELPGIAQMIDSLTSGTWNLVTALKAGAGAVKAFIAANAPLLVLSATVGIIIAIRNAIKKKREEEERAIEVSKENIRTLEEEKQGLIELSKEYATLKGKEKNLTATADEKERLKEIQRELVELYGVSITGIDEEGRAYADSTQAIYDRIEALETMIDLEKEKLEASVLARDALDIQKLEKNLEKRVQLEQQLLEVQEKIDEYTSILSQRGTLEVTSPYGSGIIDASTQHGQTILQDYIMNLNRDKLSLAQTLEDINTVITEATKDREQLLKEDAVIITQRLSENGVKITDEARAYATAMAKALSQVPKGILDLRDDLDNAIREFTASDFDEWVEKYKKALSEGDTRGIDQASESIMNIVKSLSEGKPHLDEWALAMEKAFSNSKALDDVGKATIDATSAFQRMSTAARKVIEENKELNQVIRDVRDGKVLSAETILDLIEKYDLNTDAIKEVADGYTVEIEALESLRAARNQAGLDGIQIEIQAAQTIRDQIAARIAGYGLEIEQIKNLADARRMLAQQDSKEWRKKVTARRVDEVGYDVALEEAYHEYSREVLTDIRAYEQAVDDLEALEQRAKTLEGLIRSGGSGGGGASSSGVSSKGSGSSATRYENKALEEALKLLDHRKRISEETQASIRAEITELYRINSLYAKTAEERMNLAERIYAAEKRLKDRALQDSTNWINEQRNLGQLSVEEEIEAWERVRKNQADNIEAVKQATLNLYKLRNQVLTDSYAKEENYIKHITKLGILSIEEQIEKYRELYQVKAQSIAEEQSRIENLFELYKKLISDHQRTIKVAHEERIKQIEDEAKRRKEMHEEEIKAIERELDLLNKQEKEYDYDRRMADLREQLAYWQVRTSEQARQKVAEILKQIDEEEYKREMELKRQSLEDKKKTLQDEIKAIDETAKLERERYEKSYKEIEIAFDDHSVNMIALASTMSKEMYEEFKKNYLIPLENALKNAEYHKIGDILEGVDDFARGAFERTYNTTNAQVYRLANQILEFKRQYEYGGDKSAAQRAVPIYDELTKLNPRVADMLHRSNYKAAKEYIASLPKAHTGAQVLTYGAAYLKPGELVFPPDLSIKLESLIQALYRQPISQSSNSFTDNRKEIHIDRLLNIENNYIEDEVDGEILVRTLKRAISSIY